MEENDELKICCERLQNILTSIKKNRDEIGRIHSELDDCVRELIEIIPTLLAQSDCRLKSINSTIMDLQKGIQSLTRKIDSLNFNKGNNSPINQQANENARTSFSEKQLTQDFTENRIESAKNDELGHEENKGISVSPQMQGNKKIAENETSISNQAIVEKYQNAILKFVSDYNKQVFPTSTDIKLNVYPEDKKKLSKNNLDSWNEIKDIEKICLEETTKTYSYQAQPLSLDIGIENQYYLVAPNKLTSTFTKKTVVEDAYLAFFNFDYNNLTEKGSKVRLIKPATFQKVDSLYKLISKGEIELL